MTDTKIFQKHIMQKFNLNNYDWVIFKPKGQQPLMCVNSSTSLGALKNIPVKFELIKPDKNCWWFSWNEKSEK